MHSKMRVPEGVDFRESLRGVFDSTNQQFSQKCSRGFENENESKLLTFEKLLTPEKLLPSKNYNPQKIVNPRKITTVKKL